MNSGEFRLSFKRVADLYAEGRFPEAIALLEDILEDFPDHPQVVHTYARSLLKAGRIPQARTAAQRLTNELNDPRGAEILTAVEEAARAAAAAELPSRRLTATVLLSVTIGLALYAYFGAYPRIYRIMEFPEDAPIGDLYVRHQDAPAAAAWEPAGLAQGSVAIRRSKDIRLELRPEALQLSGSRTYLEELKELEPDTFLEIDTAGNLIGDDGLRALSNFTHLKRLQLASAGISGPGLVYLKATLPLHELDISDNPLTDQHAAWIGQFKSLRILDLRGTQITAQGLGELDKLQDVHTLHLPLSTNDDGIKAIQPLANLRNLDLSARPITDRAMKFLAGFTKLEALNLSATAVTDRGVARLAELPALVRLDLSDTFVTTASLDTIARFSNLSVLDLSGTEVRPPAIPALARLGQLRTLRLARCITGDPPQPIPSDTFESFVALQELDLAGIPLSNESIGSLLTPQMKRVNLSQTGVNPAGIEELRANFADCEIEFSDPGESSILFPEDTYGVHLYAREPGTGADASWQILGEARGEIALPETAALRAEFDPGSTPHIARLAEVIGDRLTHIDLSGDSVSPETAAELAAFPNLRTIRVSAANWGDSHLDRLPALAQLEELDLRKTAVTAAGVNRLERFASLRRVQLRGTGIPSEALEPLVARLPTLQLETDHTLTRVLTFPDRSLGTLWSRSLDTPTASWSRLGPARGAIEIPDSHVLRLDVSAEGSTDLALLATLAPDAIHTLYLTGEQVTDDALRHLVNLRGLRVLNLFGAAVTDEGLRFLTSQSPVAALAAGRTPVSAMNLQEIVLNRTAVSNLGVQNLTGFAGLEKVDLAGTKVGSAGVRRLQGLPNLRRISLEYTAVTDSTLRELTSSNPALETTSQPFGARREPTADYPARVLRVQSPDPLGKVYVQRADQGVERPWHSLGPLDAGLAVREGYRAKLVLNARDLPRLSTLADLSSHSIQAIEFPPRAWISVESAEILAHIDSLEAIDLSETRLATGVIRALSALPNLRELMLHGAHFDPDDLAHVRGMAALTTLDLSATDSDASSLLHVASDRNLSTVDVHDIEGVGDTAIGFAATLPQLERLNASQTATTDIGLRALEGRAASMESINLADTNVSANAVDTLKARHTEVVINRDKRRIHPREIARREHALREMVQSDEGLTRQSLAKTFNVARLQDLADESLAQIHRMVFSEVALAGLAVDRRTLSELAGVDDLADASPDLRNGLQRLAIESTVRREGVVNAQTLESFMTTQPLDAQAETERVRLQTHALRALAAEKRSLDRDDLSAAEGVKNFRDIPDARRAVVQEVAVQALAESGAEITPDAIVAVSGKQNFDEIDVQSLGQLQTVALSVLADSETGITAESVAALGGAENFAALPESAVTTLQAAGMSAMANSDVGIVAEGIAALGGQDHYEDVAVDPMEELQDLAVATVVDSDLVLTTNTLAQIGGRDDFEEVPEDRLDTLQDISLIRMANSRSGITVDSMAQIGGADEFDALDEDALDTLQSKALSAMANSRTGLTVDGLATVAGEGSLDAIPVEALTAIRVKAVAAMATSSTGIVPSQLAEILGDEALEILDFAYANITDTDLLNIPDVTRLRVVDLTGCAGITNRTVGMISRAEGLRELKIAGTGITGEALIQISGLEGLEVLDLSRTAVSDQHLSILAYLPNLQHLALSNTPVAGSGLAYLSETPRLQSLHLDYTLIDDSAFDRVPAMTALNVITLNHTRVSDNAMPALATFENLEEVQLAECPSVTDAGFETLASLPFLRTLQLHDTEVSEASVALLSEKSELEYLTLNQARFSLAAVDSIRDAIPNCTVQGIGSLAVKEQVLADLRTEEVAASTVIVASALRAMGTAVRVIYTLTLVLATLSLAFVPFVPLYLEGFGRLQESGALGRGMSNASTGAHATAIVVNRGGRALFYAMRWAIGLLVFAIVVYVFIVVAGDFVGEFMDTENVRF